MYTAHTLCFSKREAFCVISLHVSLSLEFLGQLTTTGTESFKDFSVLTNPTPNGVAFESI